MQETVDAKQLRSFGFLVGGVFAVIGLWPMLLGRGTPMGHYSCCNPYRLGCSATDEFAPDP